VKPFDRRVLSAVRDLGGNAYGVTIFKALSPPMPESTRRSRFRLFLHWFKEPSLGAIYVALESMEERNLVTSHWGEATEERGGRRKRYYCITRLGEAALEEHNVV
jgi:DNA-binding PadR family transcriptional regulator